VGALERAEIAGGAIPELSKRFRSMIDEVQTSSIIRKSSFVLVLLFVFDLTAGCRDQGGDADRALGSGGCVGGGRRPAQGGSRRRV
jgi:hypothetical protein